MGFNAGFLTRTVEVRQGGLGLHLSVVSLSYVHLLTSKVACNNNNSSHLSFVLTVDTCRSTLCACVCVHKRADGNSAFIRVHLHKVVRTISRDCCVAKLKQSVVIRTARFRIVLRYRRTRTEDQFRVVHIVTSAAVNTSFRVGRATANTVQSEPFYCQSHY